MIVYLCYLHFISICFYLYVERNKFMSFKVKLKHSFLEFYLYNIPNWIET
jgi:hypothetical protein